MTKLRMRFHDRARDCLNIAKGTRRDADRSILEDIAAELEAEGSAAAGK